ncbi:hypothetical protein [Chitiniphilus shinanonensis]|uniref:hypothetical protein n=1 Tax=Chitiniphilus shinanonensis TaxID=553088 RepID=UPI00302E08FA
MKPFITDRPENERFTLRLQCEGISREFIQSQMKGEGIVAYALPDGHTLESAWLFRLILSNAKIFEFSSACTEVAEWQEVGSLNIRFIAEEEPFSDSNGGVFIKNNVEKLPIKSVGCLVYEDDDVYAESGILIKLDSGEKVIVASGVSPGSVSVMAPFSTEKFSAEFSISDYRYEPL